MGMRIPLLSTGLALLFACPAIAGSGQTADLSWNEYMDRNVYSRRDRHCDKTFLLCRRTGAAGYFQIGMPRRPRPGDGIQVRFGAGGDGAGGPPAYQEPAPITDFINKAAPVSVCKA